MKPSVKTRHQAIHEGDLNMDRQVYVIKTVAYSARTDRNTPHARTDKELKLREVYSCQMIYFTLRL